MAVSIGYVDQHALHCQILIDALSATFSAETTALHTSKRAFACAKHAEVDADHTIESSALSLSDTS